MTEKTLKEKAMQSGATYQRSFKFYYRDIAEAISKLKEMKICSQCNRYDCGHEDWMMVSLTNLDKIFGDFSK